MDILNRASFDDREIRHKVTLTPHIYQGSSIFDLGGQDNVFWVKQITWRPAYVDVGLPRATKSAPNPIEVSVGRGGEYILQKERKPFPPFTNPKPLISKIEFEVINTNLSNNHQLVCEFFLTGVLVTPKPGAEPLSFKEMLGYIMMDETKRGELALQEAQTDRLEEYLSTKGLGSLREALPPGWSSLNSLPAIVQQALLAGIAPNSNLLGNSLTNVANPLGIPMRGEDTSAPVLSLPMNSDPEKEKSTFLGDLVSGCPDDCQISKEHLRKISEYMVQNGWRKLERNSNA